MPKIIYDDGCCTDLYKAWKQIYDSTVDVVKAYTECYNAAHEFGRGSRANAVDDFPCWNGNPKKPSNCAWWEEIVDGLRLESMWYAINSSEQTAKYACLLAFSSALGVMVPLETAAWQAFKSCRSANGCPPLPELRLPWPIPDTDPATGQPYQRPFGNADFPVEGQGPSLGRGLGLPEL